MSQTDARVMINVIKLPHEVLHAIFKEVNPRDLAAISRSCRTLHDFIAHGSKLLFQEIYLNQLDDPRIGGNPEPADWELELHKLVQLETILKGNDETKKLEHLAFVTGVAIDLVKTAIPNDSSRNIHLLARHFKKASNRNAFIKGSSVQTRARGFFARSPPLEERQLSAKLHCLHGIPMKPPRSRISRIYPYACSNVYDLRGYRPETFWGPFINDGEATVDWEKMEAIMIVLGHNMKLLDDHSIGRGVFQTGIIPFMNAVQNSFSSVSLSPMEAPNPPKVAEDPYNVTGTWYRVICWLDFNDLFRYNFSSEQPGANIPRAPLATTEAVRMIIMELRVTAIEPPGPEDGQALPVVHFAGTSRSMHVSWDGDMASTLRGTVRLTKEGEVRWTGLSVFDGEERWKSEGVQVGGPGSGRGVIGTWFDKDFDVHGPVGPTAFWKVSNEVSSDRELMPPFNEDIGSEEDEWIENDSTDDDHIPIVHVV